MKSDFKKGRPGYAFKNGKLYWFDKRHVVVMTSWPDPRAWIKRRSHNWKATRKWADACLSEWFPRIIAAEGLPVQAVQPARCEPDMLPSGQYLLPNLLDGQRSALRAWIEALTKQQERVQHSYALTIPLEIRRELVRFCTRRWHVLNVLARCPGAGDLCHSNPALLFAVASNWVFHKPAVRQPLRAARSLVNQKQRHILDWLGFPGTGTVRHIFGKIVPQSVSVEALLYLRNVLGDPFVLKSLAHLDRINAGVLRLASDLKLREYITPRLLEDVSRDESQDRSKPSVLTLLRDTLAMARLVEWRHCPCQFSSYKRLSTVHDELARHLRPEDVNVKFTLPARFPDPPFMGTADIRPIMTPDDLFIEGYDMHHCVGMYADSVAQGAEYIYRVLRPVRATLSIRRHGRQWVSGQLFKASNQQVEEVLSHSIYADLFCSKRQRSVA